MRTVGGFRRRGPLQCRIACAGLTALFAALGGQHGCGSNKAVPSGNVGFPAYTELISVSDPNVYFGSLSFSKDESQFTAVGLDGTVRVYDTRTAVVAREWPSGQTGPTGALFAPMGTLISTVSEAEGVRVWDADTGILVSELRREETPVWACCWSADARHLFVVNNHDFVIDVHDARTMRKEATFAGHTDSIQDVTLLRDGALLASASYDGSVRIWSTSDYKPVVSLTEHPDRVLGVAASKDGSMLAAVGVVGRGSGNVVVWNTSDFSVVRRMSNDYDVSSTWFSRDGKALFTQDRYAIRFWNLDEGEVVKEVSRLQYSLDMAVFSSSERYGITLEYVDRDVPRLVIWESIPDDTTHAPASRNGRDAMEK